MEIIKARVMGFCYGVKRAIKKYKGDLNWRYEADKKEFTMTVILKEYEQVCASARQTK